jgi:hypothetical protein
MNELVREKKLAALDASMRCILVAATTIKIALMELFQLQSGATTCTEVKVGHFELIIN